MPTLGPPSLWLEEIADLVTPWSPPEDDATCEVLVVGAGLSGSACADALAAAGADVLLVDAHGPGTGASGRNAGFVLLGNAVEYPHMVERFGREYCRDLLAFSRRNHALIRDRWGEHCDYEASGSLMLSMADDPKEIETLERAAQLLREDGVDCELGAPHGHFRGFAGQLTIREDGQLHPGRLCVAMQGTVQRKALARVLALDTKEGVATLEGGSRIRFEHVVVATNAHASRLLPDLSSHVTPQRAQVLATEPLPERILPEVAYAGWGYDYFRQRSDGRLLLGGRRNLFLDDEATDDPRSTAPVQDALQAYLKRHLPAFAEAAITHRWAGIMGFTADELPFVDRLPGDHGGWVLAGFTGHGLGLAPACAQVVAARLGGAAPADDELATRMLSRMTVDRIR
jgi:glycine/D-amino acid oxidase-like deaminating enzyme